MGWLLLTGIACGLPEVGDAHDDDDTAAPAPVDADGDGYLSDVDCDDDDATMHPHADEVCLNGRNESCLEGADDCVWSGTATIEGIDIKSDTRGDDVGAPLAVCDVNADGQLDLVMAGPEMLNQSGAVYVFHGPLVESRTIDEADYTLRGTGAWLAAGSSLDCRGDVDGDGVVDLVVGQRGNSDAAEGGAAYLVSGIGAGAGPIGREATIRWRGEQADYGYEVATLDEDGNGRDDIAVTTWGTIDDTALWGRTWVISEPAESNDTVEVAAAASVYGSNANDSIIGARKLGDLDADGFEDLAVIRRSQFDSLSVFRGPLIGDWPTEDADLQITDTEQGFGHSVGHADLDGDGRTDLFVSNPDASAVYVFLEALSADTSAAAADVRILCARGSSSAGSAVVSPGDVSADDEGDLLVGAAAEAAVYLIGGGTPGVYDLDADAHAVLRGDHVGWSLATGELTGDGILDFVITDSTLAGGGSGVVVMPSLDL